MIALNIFRQYDVRGIVGSELNKDTAYLLAKAYCRLLKTKNPNACKVSIGRDIRHSSPELAGALIDGISECGISVVDIGVCPTPLQYFSLYHLDLDGGIMVTGSHNPPNYNGFKISIGKETIYGEDIQTLKDIIIHNDYLPVCKPADISKYDILSAYSQYVLNEFSYLSHAEYKKVKAVVDAGNGTAGLILPNILRQCGCDVVELYCEPDGSFPNHHPDPTVPEYITDLISTTKSNQADIGIGYDGDADRIGVVAPDGRIIWGDQIMIVLAREILSRLKGAKIIADVKCSQLLFDDIAKNGGIPIMSKTGHSLVKSRMRQERSPLAGEFSGHIFIADRYFGYDDAIYTTLRLIEIIKKTSKNILQLLEDIPTLHFTPEIRIDCPDEVKFKAVDAVVKNFLTYAASKDTSPEVLDVNTTDGVRVIFPKGWGLIRTSNTQPVVVMRVEAEDAQALEAYKEFILREFQSQLNYRQA